tara:strand:- start:119 stop:490 length:372 start_codon:yes stop_codon:yes gene_type:complete
MKKLIGMFIFCLLFSNVAFAEKKCDDIVIFEWGIDTKGSLTPDYKEGYVENAIWFRFNNPSSKKIQIFYAAVKTSSKEIMREKKDQNLILQPFTKNNYIAIKAGNNLMTELAEYGSYGCKFIN